MKQTISLLLALCLTLALTGCGGSTNAPESAPQPAAQETAPEATPEAENNAKAEPSASAEHKALVVYFSRTGENYTVGTISTGNTAQNDQAATQQAVSEWLGGMDFFG